MKDYISPKVIPDPEGTKTVLLPDLPTDARPLKMIPIPAGSFIQGSTRGANPLFSTLHPVTITKKFYLSQCEITQAQWIAVMSENPSRDYGVGPDIPVYNISWEDCQQFLQRLNDLSSENYRLPTESEWEYACRAGSTSDFYWGDETSEGYASKYAWFKREGNTSNQTLSPVGKKLPNAWGLYDMSGNLWEWCQGWHYDYPTQPQTDPTGPETGLFKMLRGGSWMDGFEKCASAYRQYAYPQDKSYAIGFRLALDYPQSIQ